MNDELKEVLRVGENRVEFVDFRMFEDRSGYIKENIYGINVAKIKEIIKYPDPKEIISIHGKSDVLEGMINLRGEVIPIVNLAKWLNIKEPQDPSITKNKKIIVANFNNVTVGFIVHEAKRIRRFAWSDIKPPNDVLSSQYENKIIGTINNIDDDDKEKVLLIVDFEKICEELGIFGTENVQRIEKDMSNVKISRKANVLIADDSSIARKIIKEAIKPITEKLYETKDGQEAWDLLNTLYETSNGNIKSILDLVITDVEMPNMDGFTLTKKIKEDPRFESLPVVVNTSLSGGANLAKAKSVGADDFCTKFIAEEFVRAVTNNVK
ncbi:two-component system, chemotaxis family, response regulator CheV [Desulfurella multipotens]|uniref:Two-component system, chemotaxis family, response regulator CheV n=1 Tax=Desulfurella multipotens TaxID=79269 RepID=A0A1G6HKQ9_9BACT|nr:chemotaxis protein [Desulfurella multipotens]SDB94801.1 two-component system, chemotaxis family, response regulator CheV [Desulfurella multipotens]